MQLYGLSLPQVYLNINSGISLQAFKVLRILDVWHGQCAERADYHVIRSRLNKLSFSPTFKRLSRLNAFRVLSPLALVTVRCAVFGHEPTNVIF